MATFLKDVLYPGTYSVSDGNGGRRKVRYSRVQVEHLTQRMKEMLAAGLSIPLAAEHQEKAKPLTPEERKADWVKRLTMGWAEKVELQPEGFLSTLVNVPVDDDAKRLPAVRFVSPAHGAAPRGRFLRQLQSASHRRHIPGSGFPMGSADDHRQRRQYRQSFRANRHRRLRAGESAAPAR